MSFLTGIFGDANKRYTDSFLPTVEKINSFEPDFEKLSDEGLKEKTAEFRGRLSESDPSTGSAGQETLDDILPEAFAAVREAARRALAQRHFDVQLVGGIVLHLGKIAEMRTGEGKTLVATLPLYLNSLLGDGAHLVTPNDYLSRVGAGWMGKIYHMLGVSVGVIAHDISGIYDPSYEDPNPHGDDRLNHFRPVTRREAYEADITYGTNNEFGFDYLRDNLEYEAGKLRQREHNFAIVDEVDSILIDEARTPLIISAPDEESADLYQVFSRLTPQLKEETDYNVDRKLKAVTITEAGKSILTMIDGKAMPVTVEEYKENLSAQLVTQAPTLDVFRSLWIDPSARHDLLEKLPDGVRSALLVRSLENMNAFDLYDVLAELGYGLNPRTRLDRAAAFTYKHSAWLNGMPTQSAETLRALALQFGRAGTDGLESPHIFETPEVNKAGGLIALRAFGQPAEILRETKTRIFAA